MKYNYFLLLLCVFFFIISCKNNSEKTNQNDTISKTENTVTEQKFDFSQYETKYNEIALWLAGKKQNVNGTYKNLEQSEAWKNYSQDLTLAFETFRKVRQGKLDTFRINELSQVNKEIKTLFYPYSGPDFANAVIYFPNAEKTIMVALEKVGSVPDFSMFTDYNQANYFTQIINSLNNILNQGYFVTKKMKVQYKNERIDSITGVLPILYIFMAQMDCYVLSTEKVTIDKNAELVSAKNDKNYIDEPSDNYVTGVKIEYVIKNESIKRTLIYFSQDLDEFKLNDVPQFLPFLAKQNINVTFLKAASYLNIWFAKIRNFTLENSDYIFQDDSGIPIKYIDKLIWEIKLYGVYTKTLDMFRDYFQKDLRDMYQTETATPLNFETGYNGTFQESNLQLFVKRK
jgi:hypothetical protein